MKKNDEEVQVEEEQIYDEDVKLAMEKRRKKKRDRARVLSKWNN